MFRVCLLWLVLFTFPVMAQSALPEGAIAPLAPQMATAPPPQTIATEQPLQVMPSTANEASPKNNQTVKEEVAIPPRVMGKARVMFLKEDLFDIYADSTTYTAQERASIIAKRIDDFAHQLNTPPIEVIYQGTLAFINSGKHSLMTITERDAMAAQISLSQLSEYYKQRIQYAVRKGQIHYNLNRLMLHFGYAIGITFVLVLILISLHRVFPLVYTKVDSLRKEFLPDIRIRNLELVSSDRMADFMLWALKVIRTLIFILLLYFYFPLVFSLFPWTRNWSELMLGYFSSPLFKAWLALVDYIPNVFVIGVIITVTHYSLKLIKVVFTALQNETITYPGFYKDWAYSTYAIVRFLVLAFAAIVIFPYLPGSNSPAFKSVSLFLGILFSLGSSSAISNIVAGVVLTYMRSFKLGDRVKIADTIGNITEKNLLVTRIRTIKNVDITIANAMVLNSHIINYSSSAEDEGLILHTSITIGYDIPWPKVHELLLKAAELTECINASPRPFVLQTSLDDFYVAYELNAYTNRPNIMARTYSELHGHILDQFNAAGVEIMSPHFTAMRDGHTVNIPEEYLAKDYRAPALRVDNVQPTHHSDQHPDHQS